MLIKNGFQLQSQFNTPTYTKVVPNKGEFSFVVMSTDPVVNFYAKNPSQDMIQSLLLKPMGDEVWYTDSEGKINRGYPYYSSFWKNKSVEESTAYKQISSYIGKIK